MIKLVAREGNSLRFTLAGKISDEDYENVLVPAMKDVMREYDMVNCQMEFTDEYEGYELGAIWEDTKFGVKHKRDFERVAVVGASKWMEWGVKIGAKLIHAELKTYPAKKAAAAWKWVVNG